MTTQEDKAVSTAEVVKRDELAVARNQASDFHGTDDSRPAPLFVQEDGNQLRRSWTEVQTRFVDDPQGSVKAADELVAATIKRLEEIFAEERNRLEQEWGSRDQVSTEDLRLALRRYRAFFDRLLSI